MLPRMADVPAAAVPELPVHSLSVNLLLHPARRSINRLTRSNFIAASLSRKIDFRWSSAVRREGGTKLNVTFANASLPPWGLFQAI